MSKTQIGRRPATAADIRFGAIVYKGQGKTAYRVTGRSFGANLYADRMYAHLVKATTNTNNGSPCPIDTLTVEE